MNIPTIFDWLERFEPLRGYPSVVIILATAILIALFVDWRLSLLALIVQYLMASYLFTELLDPRLAMVILFTGMFVCLILYMTARQVEYGRLPNDLTAEEVARLQKEQKQVAIGRWTIPQNLAVRAAATGVALLFLMAVTWLTDFRLPGVPEQLPYVNTAILILMSLGFVGIITSRDAIPMGMGLFTFLTGFEMYYAAFDQSVAVLAALSALNFIIALAVAYLAQVRRQTFYITSDE